jgi:hypothetical protein
VWPRRCVRRIRWCVEIAKMKDGRTHLAYKADAVDLETGALVAVTLQDADQGVSASTPAGTRTRCPLCSHREHVMARDAEGCDRNPGQHGRQKPDRTLSHQSGFRLRESLLLKRYARDATQLPKDAGERGLRFQ